MKLKTFFISYLLFLAILLSAIVTIASYLMNHQTTNLKEQSRVEFQRIVGTIEREVDAVYERVANQEMVAVLLENQVLFHARNDVLLEIIPVENLDSHISIAFKTADNQYYVLVTGTVATTPAIYAISASFNVTVSIDEVREIQQVLLYLFIAFSLVAALVLYLILDKIFKPLVVVTNSAQKIAAGSFDERITVQGQDELATMVNSFNLMATEVEQRINLLELEAERKQQFMDNLAHEIRTPLTSVYGYAQYLQKANLDEAEKIETTSLIIAEAEYMKQITNSMLELAKLRNHPVTKTEIAISTLFDQITKTLVIPFIEYQVELMVQPSDDIIIGQADLIRSLILNLCNNAAKACESGHGQVVLKAEKTATQLIISVTDNGCGIAPTDLVKITEPFYQVDKARNRANQGIGLGLTLCQEIAKLHDAELIITSEIDVGTTVSVVFTTS